MFNELEKLDNLLNRSVNELEKRKKKEKKEKDRLKEIAKKKEIVLEIEHIEVIKWDTKLYLAIIEVQYCSNCWNESSSIIGYYAIQTNDKLKVNRLNRIELKNCSDLKYHRIAKKIDACVSCLQAEYYDSVDLMEYLDLIKTF